MAVALLAVLVVLGLLHVQPRLAQRHGPGLLHRWVRQLDDTGGRVRVLLAVLLPVLLCLLLEGVLGVFLLGELGRLLLAVAVLVYCFGPRELESDLEALLRAPDTLSREAAARHLIEPGQPLAWNAHALAGAIALAALRRRFGVLFWFFLLGPAGALLYRLGQTVGRDPTLALEPDSRRYAQQVANALDWLPAQLLVFTLALVGHWDAVMGTWQRWRRSAQPTSWYNRGPVFLADAARAEIATETHGGDGYVEDHSDALHETLRMRSALLRALLVWLGIVALIVIGGWLR